MTGPYHFGPRLRGAAARTLGLLHLTWNKGLGWPALLLRAKKDRPLPGATQVLVTGYADYVVAEHRAGRADLVPRVLDMVAAAYEAALEEEQGRAHLASGRPDTRPAVSMTMVPWHPPASRLPRWALPVVSAACVSAACVAAFMLPRATEHVERWPDADGSPPVAYAYPERATAEQFMSDLVEFRPLMQQMGEKPICMRVPTAPMPGQDVPPNCRSPARGLNGGCWVKIADKPSPCCPENTAEHGGYCYMGLKGGVQMKFPSRIDRRAR